MFVPDYKTLVWRADLKKIEPKLKDDDFLKLEMFKPVEEVKQ